MIGYILFFGIVIIGVLIYLIAIMPKGTRVLVDIYENHGGKLVCLTATKRIKAYQKRDKNGVEKLHLPKKWSKMPLMAVDQKDMVLTQKKFHLIRLLKKAEEIYQPIGTNMVDDDKFKDLVQNRDAVGFYIDSREENLRQFGPKQEWLQKYGAVLGMTIMFICFIFAVIFITKIVNENLAEVRADTNALSDKLIDAVKNLNSPQNNGESVATDAPKPIGQNTATS